MSTVFVNIGLSLDGYMAPDGMTLEHWDNPGHKNWGAKWGALMRWIINQQFFRENLKLGRGGETGPVNEMLRKTTERIGANIMGKRMFEPWVCPGAMCVSRNSQRRTSVHSRHLLDPCY